ncbi:hypothetical protein RND81_07G107700 [Saponaria officinalis]|uniref:DUF7769 domain-containing protein n=1 Tax=Saponaria officinalis TaxID=3572 RepID=A0AAW1JQF1_SAPOF
MSNLTEKDRLDIATFLLHKSKDGQLFRGTVLEAALKWNVHRNTISTIWARAKKSQLNGSLDVKSKRYGNKNRKRILPDLDYIKTLKFSERSTIEKISLKVKVSVGTVHSWVVDGLLKPHSSPLHPLLTDLNKVNRHKFCLNSISVFQTVNQVNQTDSRLKFTDMSQTVHIDEKWFYLTRTNQRYRVVDGEELPYRSCKSKRYITKVMFMCAVSRPVYGLEGELLFDEKIGIIPFTCKQAAKRSSKNRAAGTLETKSIDSITKPVTKALFIEKIIPSIMAKWPSTSDKRIYIQKDNAKPHITNNDPDFRKVATEDGFDIQLVFQPPNSPDLNTNDLGFFRAIQSLQSEISATNVEQLVAAVDKAFTEYIPMKLNKIFLTLQTVMIEIMKAKGHNNFSIPHMNKDRLLADGRLPTNLTVDEGLVKGCIDLLLEIGETSGIENLMEELGYHLDE